MGTSDTDQPTFRTLRLADTSVRLFRKRDGRAAYHLRSYLLVNTSVGFRLSAYLKSISARLTWASGEQVAFDEITFSDDLALRHELQTMAHRFDATAVSPVPKRKSGLATLRLDYHLSFTGHPSETPKHSELVVPVIDRF